MVDDEALSFKGKQCITNNLALVLKVKTDMICITGTYVNHNLWLHKAYGLTPQY